ncbi:hypothetical protein PRIPAC_74870 [Pristionchus pacificus]|uniref:DUF3456 domain-containing protein n=1 Tax=Pristionchus pacificus TaxID=54126 RepID=A0A8R1V4P5_PRIPA|nr:hypothetical protein PRIPAC_74870 [Pristionchus pacificus]
MGASTGFHLLLHLIISSFILPSSLSFDAHPVMANKCEGCLITVKEMEEASGRMRGERSESQLIEWMEETCERLLQYHVHREREGIDRFQPHKSGTINTIETLKQRGVQVDLGFPDEFLTEPEAEIAHLKMMCDDLISRKETELEEWYYGDRSEQLRTICRAECRYQAEL